MQTCWVEVRLTVFFMMSDFKSCSDIQNTFCSQSRGLVAFYYTPERPFFLMLCLLEHQFFTSEAALTAQECEYKVLGHSALTSLLDFSLIKSPRSSPGSGKLISLNTFPLLILFFLSYLPLPYLFSSSTLRLCSFMYGSEKPATYHRSLERLSYKKPALHG